MIKVTVEGYIRYLVILCLQLSLFFRRSRHETTYVFHHLPRCGGTSLRKSLMALKSTYNDYRIGWGNLYPLKFPLSRLGNNDCLVGHFELEGYHLFQRYPKVYEDRRFVLFTFIRHPLDLLVSDYYFRLKQGEYVDADIRNHLSSNTNFLAEVLNVTDQNYKTVLNRYDFIGIFEEYEESLLRLSSLLGNKNLVIKDVNNAKKDDLINSITQEDIDKFEVQNELDFAIYNYCLERFNSNVK
jgi:hypothetical protein